MKIKTPIIRDVVNIVLVILALYLTGNPLGSAYYSQLTVVFFFVSIVGIGFSLKNTHIDKTNFLYIFILFALSFISMVVNLDGGFSHYIGVWLTHIGVLLAVSTMDDTKFKKIYINAVFIICIYSTLITVYLNLFNINVLFDMPLVQLENAGSWRTIWFLYNAWGTNAWTTFVRNSGFFREPGVLGLHICLAGTLILDKLGTSNELTRKDFRKLIVLAIAGVLTLSTVGVLGVLMLGGLYFVKLNKLKAKHIAIFISVILGSVIILTKNYNILFNKFNSANYEFISMSERTNGFISAYNVAIEHPIFGAGYAVYHSLADRVVTFYFLDLWGKYGLAYPICVTYAVYRFIKSQSTRIVDFVVISIIVFMFMISQGFADQPIMLFLELYAMRRQRANVKV